MLESKTNMTYETQPMTEEQRKAIALEYLKRLDRKENFFDLLDDHAQVCFPKWGLANGRKEFEKLFNDVAGTLSFVVHDYAYFNYIVQGETVVVEGTSYGKTASGVEWRAGITHAGRWCDIFEIRNFKIHRLFIYLDPDYASADVARYPWLAKR